MALATDDIHNAEAPCHDVWPARTQVVSYVGTACVVQGAGDFDLDDLNAVRRRFPGRHVTLDGDVITIWPRPRPAGRNHAAAARQT